MPDTTRPAAPASTGLEAQLGAVLPPSAVSSKTDDYVIDGLQPALVISPSRQEDVAIVLGLAAETGAAVVPWGGGRQQHLGNAPIRYDIALDMRGLDRVVEYEPADLTVTVEAGMALARLQQVLAEHGQWLPLDPPLEEGATIGGLLATNAAGPARHRHGTARDLLIGVSFALPNGELVKSGGRVVKNVAGYDMGKLQIGALGTLGVITQASFKVSPLPLQTAELQTSGDLPTLMSINALLADALLAVQAIVLESGADAASWSLRVRFAAGTAAVQRSLRDFEAMVSRAGARLRTGGLEPLRPLDGAVLVRASVPPAAVAAICEALRRDGAAVQAYPSSGSVYGAWASAAGLEGVLPRLRQLCLDQGNGALVIERAPQELKREVSVWGEPLASFELMRRIKAEFDPHGVLNPGRYLGGI